MSPADLARANPREFVAAVRVLLDSDVEAKRLAEVGLRYQRALAGGVPMEVARRASADVGTFRTDALAELAPVVKGSRTTAVLLGSTGTGKSHAAARALSAKGGTWIHASRLHGWTDPAWALLRSVRLVVIDEVDKAPGVERIGQHVCARHDSGHRTIVTANGGADWWAAFDPHGRLRSRIEADGGKVGTAKDTDRVGGLGIRAQVRPGEDIAAEVRLGIFARAMDDEPGPQNLAAALALAEHRGLTGDEVEGEITAAEVARRQGLEAMSAAVLRAQEGQ